MWLDHYRGLLCDLDGCLVAGGRLLPEARRLVAYARDRLVIVSNNSTDTPATLAAKLARLNLPVAPERIVLAGATAVEHLAATVRQARVAIYGAPAIVRYARSLGLVVDHDRPDVVLLTRDRQFSYARLHRLVRQIERGADFIVSNVDVSHPGPDGSRVLETGVLGHGVALCIGGARSSRALSKPGRVDAEPPAATRIGSRTRPPRAPARISWRPRSRLAPGREIEPKRRWLKGNSAETGVTSLSPGRAIVVLRRMKTGAIGHGVLVTPDERALSSWSFLTKSFSSVPFTRLFRSSVPSCCPTR
jgi:Haloacid dehalogenase-like hydrolase